MEEDQKRFGGEGGKEKVKNRNLILYAWNELVLLTGTIVTVFDFSTAANMDIETENGSNGSSVGMKQTNGFEKVSPRFQSGEQMKEAVQSLFKEQEVGWKLVMSLDYSRKRIGYKPRALLSLW